MSNFIIANELYKLGDILNFKGEKKNLVTKCRILADTIQSFNFSLDKNNFNLIEKYLVDNDEIGNILRDLIFEGKSEYIEILSKDIPLSLLKLLKIPGIGVKTLHRLYKEFNVMDIYSLKALIKEKKLKTIDYIGERGEEIISKNLNYFFKLQKEFSLAYAESIFNYIKEMLIDLGIKLIEKAGSVRRKKDVISNLNIVCAHENSNTLKKMIKNLKEINNFSENGDFIKFNINNSDLDINILICPEEYFNSALLYYTGPKSFNQFLKEKAKDFGIDILPTNYMKLNYNEKQIFTLFDLPYIPPEFRDNWREFLLLKDNLFEYNINGDLHVHTNYSDGISTLYEMISQAKELGYKFIGITDHAEDLKFAKGLKEKRIIKERLEARKIESRLKNIKVFFGIEANIRNDGSVDVDEYILKDLDFVIASVHYNFNDDLKTNMKRLIKAIKNPYVTIIGHPSGRKISERKEMEIDWKEFFNETEKSKTIVEINSTPDRLDLSADKIFEFRNRDIFYAINSDAHFAPQLNFVNLYGTVIAKRAFLSKYKIVNTFNLNDLINLLKKKRELQGLV